MLFILDTNALITARDQYYGFDQVPEFWEWLLHHAQAGRVGLPREALDEILDGKPHHGKDHLYEWAHDTKNEACLDLGEANLDLVQRVLRDGYSPHLPEDQIAALRADPFVVAHGLADPINRCVVSNEHSKPTRKPHNRKIPDACHLLNIQCVSAPVFLRMLGFRTKWRS